MTPRSGSVPAPEADAADAALTARAHERFAGERRRARRRSRRPDPGTGALPNLIVIGGLKCGTTSLHHYLNLHPEIGMSRPKELNFFVRELNWDLGLGWYRSHFDPAMKARGETSPHYTNLPRFEGVAERIAATLGGDVRLIYMVRDPIDRMLSHYLHNVNGGYESAPLEEALRRPDSAYVDRGLYAMQLEPYVAALEREQVLIVTQDELGRDRDRTLRRVFGFAGVEEEFRSEQFDREWETGSGKGREGFRLMDRAVRLPGLRALDRNFDRLPESMRWMVERIVHDPDAGAAPKPELPEPLRLELAALFADDSARLAEIAGRELGW